MKLLLIKIGRAIKLLKAKQFVLITKDKDNGLIMDTHNLEEETTIAWANFFLFSAQISGQMNANLQESIDLINKKK